MKTHTKKALLIATGTLEENIKKLQEDVLQANASHTDIEMKTVMREVARSLLNHGPIVCTQEVGQFISDTEQDLINKTKSKRRPMSFNIFKKIQRHLNVVQICVKGTAYILKKKEIMISPKSLRDYQIFANPLIGKKLMKQDADLIKALFAKTTSIKHVAKMLKRQNGSSIHMAEQQICHKLNEFKNLVHVPGSEKLFL